METQLNKTQSFGFTLIELMVVVLIMGILAAIAYPTYQKHMVKTRRAEAKVLLTQTAAALEKYFSRCNQYQTTVTNAPVITPAIMRCPTEVSPGLGLASDLSSNSYYQITIAAGSITGTCTTINCGYTLTADPNGAGVPAPKLQQNDGKLQLDSNGLKRWDRNNGGTYSASENTWE